MVVVDASALLDALLPTARRDAIVDRLTHPGDSLHAPHVLDLEVVHALRRLDRAGRFDRSAGRAFLDVHRSFAIERHSHEELLDRIWELRHNLTSYDAAYVALAEALDAPLLTSDRRLAESSGHQARIDLV